MLDGYSSLPDNPSNIDFELPENVEDEGKIIKITAYQKSSLLKFFYFLNCLISCGIYFLLCKWKLGLKIKSILRKSRISQATHLVIHCEDQTFELQPLKIQNFSIDNLINKSFKTFEYRLFKYYYNPEKMKFIPIRFSLTHLTNNQIHKDYGRGLLNETAYKETRALHGSNSTEIPEKSILSLLVDEILSPFNLFQFFSCLLWYFDAYQIYASIILFTTLVSLGLTLYDSYINMKNLRKMSFFECKVLVYRGVQSLLSATESKQLIDPSIIDYKKEISSVDLVPGDIIEVPESCIMPCDLLILNGSAIMNECMLTGESIPVLKNSLPYNSLYFNPSDENKSSILYAGTHCIETRYYLKGKIPILALVLQTGFNTMKGQLVRSILFPKNNSFQFYKDSLKFIGAMSIIAFFGFCWSLYSLLKDGADTKDVIFKCLDMITVVVPPALPTCMSVGISFALIRLRKKSIFCISPPKINISGKINIMCFDKTGTLTEEGLDTYGVRGVKPHPYKNNKNAFSRLQKVNDLIPSKGQLNIDKNLDLQSNSYLLLEILASCHSLTSVQGKLIGDPLDIKMFESTNWVLEDNNENKFDELVLAVVKPTGVMNNNRSQNVNINGLTPNAKSIDEKLNSLVENHRLDDFESVAKSLIKNDFFQEIGIIRRFEFSSTLQRMSVIVKNLQENSFRLHIKGSPEKLRELCTPESIPSNFHKVLDELSQNGFRVLACGTRILKISFKNVHKYEREKLEKNCVFMGFLIMENKLKEKTRSIIDELQSANIRTIMVTGDNALTAISVARQCNIVHSNQRVFLGDLGPEVNSTKIVWKDFDFEERELNPETLAPLEDNSSIYSEELEDEEEKKNNKEKDKEKGSLYNIPFGTEIKTHEPSSLQEKKFGMNPRFVKTEITGGFNKKDRSHSFGPTNNKYTWLTKDLILDPELTKKLLKKTQKIKEYKIQKLIDEEENPPWLEAEHENYSLALTGRAFSYILTQKTPLFNKLLEKTNIYARMKPAEKALVIQSLQGYSTGCLVGMCGDGANDCGALKTADVGVSLSEAEASIAAPFTSKIQDISCIVKLLREGRCALSTSFQCFKYITLYSMIQFASVTLLYSSFSSLSDYQFLWIDLITIFPLAIFMSYTKASKTLSTYMPTANLISFAVLSSVIGQIIIQFAFQLGIYFFLREVDFFQSCTTLHPGDYDDESVYWYCYENTTLFTFSNFQYISTVLAFSIGPPFRQHFYKNYWFTGTVIILTVLSFYFTLIPATYVQGELLDLLDIPGYWKATIVSGSLINFFFTFLYEKWIVIKFTLWWQNYKKFKKNKSLIK